MHWGVPLLVGGVDDALVEQADLLPKVPVKPLEGRWVQEVLGFWGA